MRYVLKSLLFACLFYTSTNAQVKILFDATKAETAGSADWIIDADANNLGYGTGPAVLNGGTESNAQRIPTPLQSNITPSTVETYWTGALSAWGIDCVKKGYQVETLPYNGAITYSNSANAQDLSNYKIFVVVEPNIFFTASEKTAIMDFVKNGGSLFMVSDHTVSDRNNDGYDSPAIWNDLLTNNTVQNNPFGFTFDLANISVTTSNLTSYASDSLLHGSYGNVSQIKWSNGTTMTINPTVNPSVRAAFYNTGSSNTGTTGVMVAYARFGAGKVVAFGDSSPFDDGTGDPNDNLFTGYTGDVSGNHRLIIMNATVWLATTTTLPVTLTNFSVVQQTQGIAIDWATLSEVNTKDFIIEKSRDGIHFSSIATIAAKGASNYEVIDENVSSSIVYYRLQIVDKDGSVQYSRVVSVIALSQNIQDHPIYPNPAKQTVCISNAGVKKVIVVNNLGKQVLVVNSVSNQTIDVSSLPKGQYILQMIDTSGNVQSQKFIKE